MATAKRKGKTLNSHSATMQQIGSVQQTCSWFSIQYSREHEAISQHIYLDKRGGCRGVIETTCLVMRGTSHDGGG